MYYFFNGKGEFVFSQQANSNEHAEKIALGAKAVYYNTTNCLVGAFRAVEPSLKGLRDA